ncbi:MAG: amidohydrolase family protein, partial [Myxococcota bacterium]
EPAHPRDRTACDSSASASSRSEISSPHLTMRAGAIGLATGLEYDPGIYSSREEVIALASEAASLEGRYISHVRSEDRWFWEAVDEIIEIGRATAMPVQISHIKLALRRELGKANRLVEVLDQARGFGSYPRFLGRYVRERQIMDLAAAVYKSSGLAAAHLGIADRGVIRPSMKADLVLFDPDTVLDRATPESPEALSVGIERVWVNGEIVFENGKTTGRHPGEVIRHEIPD